MRGREAGPGNYDQPSDFHHDLDAVDWRRLRTPSPEVGRSSKTYAGVSDLNHGYEAFQSVRQESPIICSTPPPFAMSSSPPPPPEFGSAGNQTLPQLQLRVSSSSAACAEAESIDSPPAPTIARRRKGGKRASTEARILAPGLVQKSDNPGPTGANSRKSTGSFSSKESWVSVSSTTEIADGEPLPSQAAGYARSRGSVGHPYTCSAPCKYVRKSRGCKDGDLCSHCHLCPWKNVKAPGKEVSQ
mmetsp:Transcript_21968/g.51526  ORF Transcript_21968/g.51526 Transcript_21968/m.51526 type:complete len:244 (+) Transcript_21968:84-815(+)